MNQPLRRWLQVAFINLMLVAFLGIVLRVKIVFPLPFIDQKYLLHGHSHFAFAGWISQALMALLVAWLGIATGTGYFRKYRWLLYANLVAAYGMLASFPFQGYGAFSISFSTLSIIVSYIFAFRFWKDLNRLPACNTSRQWFKMAVFLNALSSLGVFVLAFMMATKNVHHKVYLAAVYFYLHFQYNGWFFFACMGLLVTQLKNYGVKETALRTVYRLFAGACIPAYFLSALWLPLPLWVYLLIVLAVFMQLGGWWLLLRQLAPLLKFIKGRIPLVAQRLFLLSAIALSIKLCLQAGSVIPSLSTLAFGFRPIVIGYLHLVLLGIITLFITGYCIAMQYIPVTKAVVAGIAVFVTGILLNETLLMVQGIADLSYMGIPFINTLLLAAALVLFAGIFIINYGIGQKTSGRQ